MVMNGSLIGAVFGPRGYILFLHLSLSLSLKHSLHKKNYKNILSASLRDKSDLISLLKL